MAPRTRSDARALPRLQVRLAREDHDVAVGVLEPNLALLRVGVLVHVGHDGRFHGLRALRRGVEIVDHEPQQETIAHLRFRVPRGAVVVVFFPRVELEHEVLRAVRVVRVVALRIDDALVFFAPVAARGAEQGAVPAAALRHVLHVNERLRSHRASLSSAYWRIDVASEPHHIAMSPMNSTTGLPWRTG